MKIETTLYNPCRSREDLLAKKQGWSRCCGDRVKGSPSIFMRSLRTLTVDGRSLFSIVMSRRMGLSKIKDKARAPASSPSIHCMRCYTHHHTYILSSFFLDPLAQNNFFLNLYSTITNILSPIHSFL